MTPGKVAAYTPEVLSSAVAISPRVYDMLCYSVIRTVCTVYIKYVYTGDTLIVAPSAVDAGVLMVLGGIQKTVSVGAGTNDPSF